MVREIGGDEVDAELLMTRPRILRALMDSLAKIEAMEHRIKYLEGHYDPLMECAIQEVRDHLARAGIPRHAFVDDMAAHAAQIIIDFKGPSEP